MKAHIKIPRGWYRLKTWSLATKTDRWLDLDAWRWRKYRGKRVVYSSVITIRRKNRAIREMTSNSS